MKKYTIVILVCISFMSITFAERVDEEGYNNERLKQKMNSFQAMRIVGYTFVGLGASSLVSGIVMLATSETESSYGNGVTVSTSDPKGGRGIGFIVAGIPTVIGGIVFANIGTKKYFEYKDRAELYTIFDPSNSKIGIGLSVNLK